MAVEVAVLILLIVLIVAALAVYLVATIQELVKITKGLDIVIGGVGEIVAKSAPVNGVLDAINKTLVTGRDLLEGLLIKKAGNDAAGLVESLFPGEGANFLRRVGRSGKVVNVGTVYTRGVGILASLGRGAPIGAAHERGPAVRDPQYQTTEVAKLYPAPAKRRDPQSTIPKSPVVGTGYGPKGGPQQYVPTSTPGERPGRPRRRRDGDGDGDGGGGGGSDGATLEEVPRESAWRCWRPRSSAGSQWPTSTPRPSSCPSTTCSTGRPSCSAPTTAASSVLPSSGRRP